MNCTYKSIWNDKTGTFVAVAENAMRAGRSASCRGTKPDRGVRFFLKAMTVSLLAAFGGNIYALPVGGVVAQGGASISNGAGSTTITQSSQNVAINWQSFSIGTGQTVQFVQPNSSSVALNRVLGTDPSSILGSMSANGKVFLLNPNGILFGSGSQVNVGGLVASTLNMTDSDFMAGNYRFSGSSNAAVVNQGTINAPGGYVALLGANVGNDGTIVARLGTVALAAGTAMTLDVAGDGLLNVTVSAGAVNALARNGGLIQADGGHVLLTAMAAGDLLQSAVNNTGVIRAQTIENHNGTIRLLGDMQSGTVNVGGALDASGTGAGQTGGSITVSGHHVGLFATDINASGDAGGGSVLVGGGFQGKNPAVQNATATYMSADSTISADAISNGSGGTVVLWANDSTRARGSITARGGAQGGDGGLIETSAHWLDVVGIKVNAGAPNGNAGTWLLDPADVTIGNPTAGEDIGGGVFTPSTGVAAASVSIPDLVFALTNGNVTINTVNNGISGGGAGDITVLAPFGWGTVNTLTLNAVRNINVNLGADITPIEGNLTMKAGGNVLLASAISITRGNLVVCCGNNIDVTGAITTVNGSILLSGAGTITVDANVKATDGNITMCAGVNVLVNQTVTVTNGSVTAGEDLGLLRGLVLSAGNAATGPGAAGGGGSVIFGVLPATVTAAPTNITYNPVSYSAPLINYVPNIIGTAPVVRRMVFPGGADKVFDGTTVATFTSFKPDINGLVPANITLAGAGVASFDTPAVGLNKPVAYNGFTLAGVDAALYALPNTVIPLPIADPATAGCCGGGSGTTTANIIAALPIVPPVPPVAPPAAEEMLGPENLIPAGVVLSQLPSVVLAGLPPQLLSIAPPPPVVVPPPPPPPVIQEAPIYVPPVRPAKQDRN
jgi:filamentous hemagglutinin family protein